MSITLSTSSGWSGYAHVYYYSFGFTDPAAHQINYRQGPPPATTSRIFPAKEEPWFCGRGVLAGDTVELFGSGMSIWTSLPIYVSDTEYEIHNLRELIGSGFAQQGCPADGSGRAVLYPVPSGLVLPSYCVDRQPTHWVSCGSTPEYNSGSLSAVGGYDGSRLIAIREPIGDEEWALFPGYKAGGSKASDYRHDGQTCAIDDDRLVVTSIKGGAIMERQSDGALFHGLTGVLGRESCDFSGTYTISWSAAFVGIVVTIKFAWVNTWGTEVASATATVTSTTTSHTTQSVALNFNSLSRPADGWRPVVTVTPSYTPWPYDLSHGFSGPIAKTTLGVPAYASLGGVPDADVVPGILVPAT